MANAGDLVDQLTRRKGMFSARDVLFPELGAVPVGRLAEGILRAPRRGWRSPPILSACAPERSTPSALPAGLTTSSRLLGETGWESPELLARAAAARQAMVAARVGGAWWVAGAEPEMPESRLAVVALAEPALADPAADRRADPETAAAMLGTALSAYSPKQVVVLTPSRTTLRLYPSLAAARARGAIVIERTCDPWSLLDRADRVYSIGGEIGFLGLLAGLPVSAFAAAEYTGWGVTDDNALPLRGFRRSVDEIFAGICLVATRCRDPFRDVATGFEDALAILAEWRRIETMNRRIAVCVGMSFWKRRRIADFLRSSAGAPVFRRTIAGALEAARAGRGKEKGAIAGWASRLPAGLRRGGRSCRRNVDPRRGRLHPLGRARLRLPAACLARVRCERDVFRSARRQRSRMPAARQRFFSRSSRPRRAAQRASRRAWHHQVQSGVRRPDRRHPGG